MAWKFCTPLSLFPFIPAGITGHLFFFLLIVAYVFQVRQACMVFSLWTRSPCAEFTLILGFRSVNFSGGCVCCVCCLALCCAVCADSHHSIEENRVIPSKGSDYIYPVYPQIIIFIYDYVYYTHKVSPTTSHEYGLLASLFFR